MTGPRHAFTGHHRKALAVVICLIVASACGRSGQPRTHTDTVGATPAPTSDSGRTWSRDTVRAKPLAGLRGIDTIASIDSLLAQAKRYPLSASAPSAILNVTPGSSLLDASQLHPYHRTYVIFSFTCEPKTDEPPTRSGNYSDDLTYLSDSTILRVETWHRGTDPEVRDSTVMDRRTLALRTATGHREDWSDRWVVQSGKVSYWSSDMHVAPSQSVDTNMGEPAFKGGTLEILLPITPRAYPGDASISYRFLGLATHPGDPPEITVDNLAVRTMDTATVQPVGGLARAVWVVSADDGATYWIDRETGIPIGWDVPQYESICEQKYVLSL